MRKVRKAPHLCIKLPLCSFLLQFKTERRFSRVHDVSTHLNWGMSFLPFRLESVRAGWSQRETDSQQFWSLTRQCLNILIVFVFTGKISLGWNGNTCIVCKPCRTKRFLKNPQSFRAFSTEFYQIFQRFCLKIGPWLTFLSSLCTKHIHIQIMLVILNLPNLW